MSDYTSEEEAPFPLDLDLSKIEKPYNVIKHYCKENKLTDLPFPDDITYHIISFLHVRREYDGLGIIHFINSQSQGYAHYVEYYEWEQVHEIVEGCFHNGVRVGVWKHYSPDYRLRTVNDHDNDIIHYYYPTNIEMFDDVLMMSDPYILYNLTDEIVYHTCQQGFHDSIKPSLVRQRRQQ